VFDGFCSGFGFVASCVVCGVSLFVMVWFFAVFWCVAVVGVCFFSGLVGWVFLVCFSL